MGDESPAMVDLLRACSPSLGESRRSNPRRQWRLCLRSVPQHDAQDARAADNRVQAGRASVESLVNFILRNAAFRHALSHVANGAGEVGAISRSAMRGLVAEGLAAVISGNMRGWIAGASPSARQRRQPSCSCASASPREHPLRACSLASALLYYSLSTCRRIGLGHGSRRRPRDHVPCPTCVPCMAALRAPTVHVDRPPRHIHLPRE